MLHILLHHNVTHDVGTPLAQIACQNDDVIQTCLNRVIFPSIKMRVKKTL